MTASCAAALAGYLGVFTEELPAAQYLYLFFAVLSGVSVGDCFWGRIENEHRKIVPEIEILDISDETAEADITKEPAEEAKVPVAENAQSDTKTTKDGKKEDGGQETEEYKRQGRRYIENPLPLPKPHRKRVLDFARPVIPDRDDFDVKVDENDDFDIL